MKAIVSLSAHRNDSFSEPVVIFEKLPTRPLQQLSESQLATVPAEFRCFCCQDKYKKRDIGGIEYGQRICRNCFPYLSAWKTGSIIKFDIWHNFPVEY